MSVRHVVKVTAGVLMAAGLSMASTSSMAVRGYLTTLTGTYPAAAANSCLNCHTTINASSSSRNAFGSAFSSAGHSLTAALKAADTDGDGFSNDAELSAGFLPGDANSHPASATTTTARPTTTTAAPTTTTTARPTTTTAAPTTTTTARPTTTTAAPTTTTTAAPTTTTTTASTTTTTLAPLSGAALYAQSCAGCHGPLASSDYAGASASLITSGISGVSSMRNSILATNGRALTAAEIQSIANALAAPTTTTTTAAPTTTTTARPTTTTAAPTTTTTARPTTTTAAPTTTTTARPTTTTAAVTTTTTARPTTTTTASTTTTTLAQGSGGALYQSFCASCHSGAAAGGGGRQVLGARTCSINGSINGTRVFPNGVPAMQFLQGVLSAAQIQAIADFLNVGTVTGQQRYITACAGCHGADARGGRTGDSVRGASAGDTREAIDDHGEMRFLRCLPSSDLYSIGSYLRGTRSGDGDHDEHDD